MSDRSDTGQRVLQPPSWSRPRGYANGIVAGGETIFLAGQIGWDSQGRFAEGLANQVGLLTAIVLPTGTTVRVLFDRSLRPIVTLALGLDFVNGRITGGRAAIGCAYPVPIAAKLPFDAPLPPAELAHRAAPLAHAVAAGLPEPLGDHHGSSGYRRRMIEVLLRRNLCAVA